MRYVHRSGVAGPDQDRAQDGGVGAAQPRPDQRGAAMQRELKAELEAAGAHDPYFDEELALLEGGTLRTSTTTPT